MGRQQRRCGVRYYYFIKLSQCRSKGEIQTEQTYREDDETDQEVRWSWRLGARHGSKQRRRIHSCRICRPERTFIMPRPSASRHERGDGLDRRSFGLRRLSHPAFVFSAHAHQATMTSLFDGQAKQAS